MIVRVCTSAAAAALVLLAAAFAQAFVAPAAAQGVALALFEIGYVEIEDDPRYAREFVYARIPAVPKFRPWEGAELGIIDADSIGQFSGQDFDLVRYSGTSVDDIAAWILQTKEERGIHFFLMDLGSEDIRAVSAATANQDVVLFNVVEPDDALRSEYCAAHLMHTAPSYNMLMDALTQYLVFQNWTRMLVLQGPLEDDAKMVAALERSVRRNGANIIAKRDFVLSNDPREREQNNVRLMTGGTRDYDVVFIADTDGEFGRYVPYQTVRARPVAGTAGLVAEAWQWTFERHGAPQLNGRFFRSADRFMTGPDWSAWAAVKAITQASIRANSIDFDAIREVITSEDLNMDGYKGFQSNFRPWNNQLRQNVLVSVHNAVIARAPIDKFEHAINDLDTLGIDEPENKCVF